MTAPTVQAALALEGIAVGDARLIRELVAKGERRLNGLRGEMWSPNHDEGMYFKRICRQYGAFFA